MSNAFAPIAEVALMRVLDGGRPVTPRAVHEQLESDVDLLLALRDAFNTAQGWQALQVQAVAAACKEYGDAVDTGRDAEHVAEHNRTTMARRLAMKEKIRADLDRSIRGDLAALSQLTLDDDLDGLALAETVAVEAQAD
jgi:hypothetical protein